MNEIKELLQLKNESQTIPKHIKNRTLIKIKDVENKMLDLYRIKGALEHLAYSCEGRKAACGCQIMEALDPDTQERIGWRYDHQDH